MKPKTLNVRTQTGELKPVPVKHTFEHAGFSFFVHKAINDKFTSLNAVLHVKRERYVITEKSSGFAVTYTRLLRQAEPVTIEFLDDRMARLTASVRTTVDFSGNANPE